MKTRLGGKEILEGLRDLIKDAEETNLLVDKGSQTAHIETHVKQLSEFVLLPTSYLKPSTSQPRCVFNEEKLIELSESIKQHGIIQPLIVRKIAENNYEIIAGERRWRASKKLGLAEVPAIIREVPDEALVALSLIENIQRDDLNAIEEARAIESLIEEFKLTHEQVADSIGRSRSSISNLLRLLTLDKQVQTMLLNSQIEMGHARALLSITTEQQENVAKNIINKGRSVRATEAYINSIKLNSVVNKKASSGDLQLITWEKELSELLGMNTKIYVDQEGKGKLVCRFANIDKVKMTVNRLRKTKELTDE